MDEVAHIGLSDMHIEQGLGSGGLVNAVPITRLTQLINSCKMACWDHITLRSTCQWSQIDRGVSWMIWGSLLNGKLGALELAFEPTIGL